MKCLLGVVGASLHTQDGEPGAEGLGFSCFKLPLNKNQRGLGRFLEYFFDFFMREVALTFAREVPLATLQEARVNHHQNSKQGGHEMPPWGGGCLLAHAGWGARS